MKVISNASPLIALGKLGQLGLLLKLYKEILIPHEVYHEVVINGYRLGASEAHDVDFLVQQSLVRIVEVTLPKPLPAWAQAIDAGEMEVILLALQDNPDWVIIDNAHARRAARQLGLPLKGTVGILLDAFRQKYLSLQEFELIIANIKAHPSYWISERLCDQALVQARQEAKEG